MKKIMFSMFLSICLIVVMSGCGGGSGSSKTPVAESSSPSSSSASAQPGDGNLKGKLEIQYFVGGYGDAWWKSTIAQFKELHPGLEVTEHAGPKINEQMKTRWIQGNPPDVVYIDGDGTFMESILVKNQQLMDITDWIKTAKNVDGELIKDQLIGQSKQYDGKNYALPLVFGVYGMWYDKALFKEKGWNAPTDWPSFLEANKKGVEFGVKPIIFQGQYPYYFIRNFMRQGFVTANGGNPAIIDDINSLKEGVFKSGPVMTTLGKIEELNKLGYLNKAALALNHTDSETQFLLHKALFVTCGIWIENEMKKTQPAGFEYGYLPSVTQDKGGKNVVVPYTNEIGIAKDAKNVEAAKAFLQFIYTKKAAISFAEKSGAPMNFKVDLASSKASDSVKNAVAVLNSPNTVVTATDSAFDPDVEKAMEDATAALLGAKITKEEWSDRMEQAATKARNK